MSGTHILLALLVVLSSICGTEAADPIQLGITEFTTNGYGSADAAVSIRASLEKAFIRSPHIELVDRQHLQALIQEITFQQSGVTVEETSIGLGELSNVQALLFGEVGRLDAKTFALTVRVVDVASGRVLHVEQMNLPREAKAITRGSMQLGLLLAQLAAGFSPAPMVTIPAASFTMGRTDGPAEEQPAHTVFIDSFAIDQTEVSRAAYALYSRKRGEPYDAGESPMLPATGVSWNSAVAYCADQGKRLPSEAEWELAARGPDGNPYPWGNEPPQPSLAHFSSWEPTDIDTPLAGTTPQGVAHMSGNIAEWVSDWWDPKAYHTSSEHNPIGPARGEYRVIRGGSYADPASALRATSRAFHTPMRGAQTIGFRCAATSP